MNWAKELLDLYEKNKALAGEMTYMSRQTKKGEVQVPLVLLPVSHTTVAAQLTVTIDEEGNFLRAETVPETDKLTVIPVTEKSGSRTWVMPHPYCDNLKYLAGDYMDYWSDPKGKGKDFRENYQLYINALGGWSRSEYSHKKVQALYLYLQKGCLIHDLVEAGMIQLDEDGQMTDKVKIHGIVQTDAFVRFRIAGSDMLTAEMLADKTGQYRSECWLDKTLQENFIRYYSGLNAEKEISYLTGEQQVPASLHPKKIRNEGDSGKLFSANDKDYFTFRGRFADDTQAFSIGYEDSQKIHNALKWIIRKQGFSWDDLSVVIWESDLKLLPDIKADTDRICEEYEGWGEEAEEETDHYKEETGESEHTYLGTDEAGAGRFGQAMRGYERQFGDMSKTVLMAFDSATPGRVSMTEYRDFMTSSYLENIRYWHESCQWLHTKLKNGKYFAYLGMCGVEEIAEVLYGTDQGGYLSLNGKNRIYAELYKRLLPCITERKKIPEDLVRLAVHRASSPMSFQKWYNWGKAVELACSLIKKQYREQIPKEEWDVALDKECSKRDYLYGRLLAVADRIEYSTFDKDEKRETNAHRYMSAFALKPMQTWKVIEEKLQPYWTKLNATEAESYRKLLDEIYDKFTVENYEEDKSLNGLYLLGYHSQSKDFR